jgi:glucose-1-phosphate thymidylyltransferase
MKALIAAGGHATRLRPITSTTNKHIIPLANKPMILLALEKIIEAGIRDIAINVNPGDRSIESVVGYGDRWGAHITYLEQQGGALGVAHVVANARPFLGDEPFLFYLGDNILLGSLKHMVERFVTENLDCMLALSRVRDPQRFGVPVFENGVIVRVEEKPANPVGNLVQTGFYLYRNSFFEAFKNIKPSARGEYEISDVNTWLIQRGYRFGWEEISGYWKDTGKPEDLLHGNQLLLNELEGSDEAIRGDVHPLSVLQGNVHVGKGTVIGQNVLIRGPVVVGEGCVIENAYIGPYTSIGNGVKVLHTEIEHSIIFDGVHLECGKRIVDSLVGFNAKVVSASASLPLGHKMIVGDNSVVEI